MNNHCINGGDKGYSSQNNQPKYHLELDPQDQLLFIFNILGTQSKSETSFLTHLDMKNYLRKTSLFKHIKGADFKELYPTIRIKF